MNKFWNWMKQQSYITSWDDDGGFINFSDGVHHTYIKHYLSKQMLIGYMIEYIYEKDSYIEFPSSVHDIENIYDYLKRRIEEIE